MLLSYIKIQLTSGVGRTWTVKIWFVGGGGGPPVVGEKKEKANRRLLREISQQLLTLSIQRKSQPILHVLSRVIRYRR